MEKEYKQYILLFIMTLLVLTPMVVFGEEATPIGNGAINEINTLKNSYLMPIVRGVGDVLMLLGGWKFAIGITSDEAGRLSSGTAELFTGIVIANIDKFL